MQSHYKFWQALVLAKREVCLVHFAFEIIVLALKENQWAVLTSRVAWLVLKKKVDPARIIVVTFTNKAAREMKERLEAPGLLGKAKSEQLKMGTFHSLCARFLRSYGAHVGLKQNFTIADTDMRYFNNDHFYWFPFLSFVKLSCIARTLSGN